MKRRYSLPPLHGGYRAISKEDLPKTDKANMTVVPKPPKGPGGGSKK